jgi:2-(1,2-epoxy-1,2-dihydrophenyl)acetyl-CoA isomerase
VLTGAVPPGRHRCKSRGPRDGLNPGDPDEFLRDYFMPPYQLLADLRIPTIAAVNGPCAGAGMSLALTCDIVVAAESAYFLQPFVNIGLVPYLGSSWLLPHSLGKARAAGLMLLGEKLPATTAQAWGLIWKAVPDASLHGQAQQMAEKFAAGAALSHTLTKQLLRQAFHNDLNAQMRLEVEHQGVAIKSPDFLEAKAAFLEKRQPVFGQRAP